MPDSAELLAVKADGERLCQVLGLTRYGRQSHRQCKVCGSPGALAVHESGGVWGWKCFSCGKGGTIVDAIMLLENKRLPDVLHELAGPRKRELPEDHRKHEQREWEGGFSDRERAVPVPDKERMEAFIKARHEYLLAHLGLVQQHERGLSEDVIRRYRVGFAQNLEVRFYPNQRTPHVLRASWILPVADDTGEVKGVKMHHEEKPVRPNGELFEGKCSWAPFGTEPKYDREKEIKPNDSFYTLWPWPASFEDKVSAVSSDPAWWVKRIPDGSPVMERWNTQLQWSRYEVAHEVGKLEEALTESEIWQAFTRAFAALADDIQKVVLKTMGIEEKTGRKPALVPEDWYFLMPGELKALAAISDGLKATASTGGEAWIPSPRLLSWFRGRRVCLMYDDDATRIVPRTGKVVCPGKEWAHKLALGLDCAHAADVAVFTCGHEMLEPPPEAPAQVIEREL